MTPRPVAHRLGCEAGNTRELLHVGDAPRANWESAFVEAYQRYRCSTKEESNTSNFNDGNRGPARSLARARSRVVWESRLWVQRFAIITFRACRFVCINSVRQFPLCGVYSRVRASANLLPLALLAFVVQSSVPDERKTLWKRITLVPPSLRTYTRNRETRERPDPFQEEPAIRESVNACLLFLVPFSLSAFLPVISRVNV